MIMRILLAAFIVVLLDLTMSFNDIKNTTITQTGHDTTINPLMTQPMPPVINPNGKPQGGGVSDSVKMLDAKPDSLHLNRSKS